MDSGNRFFYMLDCISRAKRERFQEGKRIIQTIY